ncbi:MAG: ATP-binding domain-containing protein [Chlamydiales bacterium]|nr:ATP-binding domain-containing protein [Chlamydiales bacterium]
MEQNYRSCGNILDAANALIRHNTNRYEKNLWSAREKGEKIGLLIARNDHTETDFVVKQLYHLHRNEKIPLNECVIFYRTNFQSRIFEDALLKYQIPYRIIGGLSFYQRKEIKDILSLLRMVLGGSDYLAFSRTINIPKRGIGEAILSKLRETAEEENGDILTTCIRVVNGKTSLKPTARQRSALLQYTDMILALKEMVKARIPLHEIIASSIERSSYFQHLKEEPETFDERKGNIEELISKAAEWEQEAATPTLTSFLEELTLKSNAGEHKENADTLRLMTIHNSKGLEFRAVFMVGMEEDLFPHINAKDNADAIEEERRLCYVGMTRAKEHLYLTASRYRMLWGMPRMMRPSRFLKEIPFHLIQEYPLGSVSSSDPSLDEPQEMDLSVGDQVSHPDFGEGTIQKSYQTSFGTTYDVLFPSSRTTRSLVAKFAKLTKSF